MHRVISADDAERAIYIDFEGFEEHTPALLGVLVEDAFEQIVLDDSLNIVAAARQQRSSTLLPEVQLLLQRSISERRYIVAYSQHERRVIHQYTGIDIGDRYRDARMIANRWRSTMNPKPILAGRGLKDYLALIKYPRPAYLGNQKSTKRLRAVRDMVLAKGSYEALTPVKKQQWTKLLEHNAVDCRGMQALVCLAARESKARRDAVNSREDR